MAKMEPVPRYGDLFSMEEFVEMVRSGCLIDYDGFGHYATSTEMSDIEVHPSDAPFDRSWTHVVWFNR